MDELKWNFISVQKRVCMLCKRGYKKTSSDPHPRPIPLFDALLTKRSLAGGLIFFEYPSPPSWLCCCCCRRNSYNWKWRENGMGGGGRTPGVVACLILTETERIFCLFEGQPPIYSITASHVLIFWRGRYRKQLFYQSFTRRMSRKTKYVVKFEMVRSATSFVVFTKDPAVLSRISQNKLKPPPLDHSLYPLQTPLSV